MTQISSAVMRVYVHELLLVKDISTIVGLRGRSKHAVRREFCMSSNKNADVNRAEYLLLHHFHCPRYEEPVLVGTRGIVEKKKQAVYPRVMYFCRKETVWSVLTELFTKNECNVTLCALPSLINHFFKFPNISACLLVFLRGDVVPGVLYWLRCGL